MDITAQQVAHLALCDPVLFSRVMLSMPLRKYQSEVIRAIAESVRRHDGANFVIEMARQAGKNEVSAHLEAYLLTLYRRVGGEMVKASPTFKPQTERSMLRLENRLMASPWLAGLWAKKLGYIYAMQNASIAFLSGELNASVVGGTASLLLELDEAQNINKAKYAKDFAPMRASTNATAVFYGTAWTDRTLLFDQLQEARRLERKDHIRRVFKFDWQRIAEENPDYGRFVRSEIDRLGENHPIIKTQYRLLEIDAEGRLLPPARQALLHGTHERQRAPVANHTYIMTIDVAGEDEGQNDKSTAGRDEMQNKRRDNTTLTVAETIEPHAGPGFHFNGLRQPGYFIRDRKMWLGVKHSALFGEIHALIEHWQPRWIVIDATGAGTGLASFLLKAFPERVIVFEFSAQTKSDLGWDLIALIETGRLKDYANDQAPDTAQFWYEVEACEYQVSDGPGQMIKWGVWDSPAYDGLVARGHDDFLIGAALIAVADKQPQADTSRAAVVQARDPLADIDRGRF